MNPRQVVCCDYSGKVSGSEVPPSILGDITDTFRDVDLSTFVSQLQLYMWQAFRPLFFQAIHM